MIHASVLDKTSLGFKSFSSEGSDSFLLPYLEVNF